MSRRNPHSKSHRTFTARLVRAVAADLRMSVQQLEKLATEYEKHTGDHEDRAAQVDEALDYAVKIARSSAWPRAWKGRVLLQRVAGPGSPICQALPLGPAKCLVIVCRRMRDAMNDVSDLAHRNPRDRRLVYVSDLHGLQRVQGLHRTTPWIVHGWPEQDGHEIEDRMRARFDKPQMSISGAVALIDWSASEGIVRKPEEC